jgi:hypothetical protein
MLTLFQPQIGALAGKPVHPLVASSCAVPANTHSDPLRNRLAPTTPPRGRRVVVTEEARASRPTVLSSGSGRRSVQS